MITVGTIKYGLTTATTSTMPANDRKICMTSIMTAGRISSTCPMSLENRFRIRPEGFVLKKYMDALVTPVYMALCRPLDALIANCKGND